jgi:hypothetical protein
MIDIKTKYHIGDEIALNERKWFIESIRIRFGRMTIYDLSRIKKDGNTETITMETVSLEKILG